MRPRRVLIAALVAALLSGCGDAPGPMASASPEGTPPTPQQTVTSRDAVPPPDSGPPEDLAHPTPQARTEPAPTVTEGEITIVGRLVEGVEPGCLVLRSGTDEYLLILPRDVDRSALTAGPLTVRGRLEPGLATTCQQGTPLLVTEIRPG